MKLYWLAAFYVPTEEELEKADPKPEAKIIIEPRVILAKDDQVAQMKATRLIPAEYEDRLETVTLAIRPF